jgi:hypothetical protein
MGSFLTEEETSIPQTTNLLLYTFPLRLSHLSRRAIEEVFTFFITFTKVPSALEQSTMPKSSASRPKTGRKRVHAPVPDNRSGPGSQTTSIQVRYPVDYTDTCLLISPRKDQSTIHGQQQSYITIQRDWPQASFAWPLSKDASNIPARAVAGTDTAAGRDLTPLERWQTETSRQSSWNNIGSVATVYAKQDNKQNTSGMNVDGTDNGSWWPCYSGAGHREA